LYGARRPNFAGLDLTDYGELASLRDAMSVADTETWTAAPIVGGDERSAAPREITSPANREHVVGRVSEASTADIERALELSVEAARAWAETPVMERAECLRRLADLMEQETPQLMTLAVREAGKTMIDALAEVREAVDFCRYYALRAEHECGVSIPLRVPRAEGRSARLMGGGVFCCISPWNFPLAIFTGQITAALAAGNAVLAKPAEQTPLIAAAGVRLMHRAGIPGEVLQLLPGDGVRVGGTLVTDPRVTGVCFTGSTEVAQGINKTLAAKAGPLHPLIAETGGLNAMIVDSSALPEQVTRDVIMSAFQSAGQRCSALRVLFVQAEVAERIVNMIRGAMEELSIGDPSYLSTDVGPVIDDDARSMLEAHIRRMRGEGRLVQQVHLGPSAGRGTFVPPTAFEIDDLSRLEREVFGPILHIIRYQAHRLDAVIDAINATGYGLTHGIHTRVDETRDYILSRVRAGNVYVNRNQIGAVVGVQPFGGEGLSGTGPKAGGPHYLTRFTSEAAVEPASKIANEVVGSSTAQSVSEIGIAVDVLSAALQTADDTCHTWATTPIIERVRILEHAAHLVEKHAYSTLPGSYGADEMALAADYLRFYAAQADSELSVPETLPGPTGERNELSYAARGTVACLATAGTAPFVAQIGAALATGNSVVAWHAKDTLAHSIVALLREAGVPTGVLQHIGSGVGARLEQLILDPRVDAIAFAGAHFDIKAIAGILANSEGPIRPLIPYAELAHEGGAPGSPLAGSPRYLYRFVLERAVSIDTTASGGNASLFSLDET
jgi:RHH-type proline utilization regulon transcriptional repressor/proline dehydrogenase/delta 1-pyrroline-5-carboxylate dehydrogenase